MNASENKKSTSPSVRRRKGIKRFRLPESIHSVSHVKINVVESFLAGVAKSVDIGATFKPVRWVVKPSHGFNQDVARIRDYWVQVASHLQTGANNARNEDERPLPAINSHAPASR